MSSVNKQVEFWKGQFGREYTERNNTNDKLIMAKIAMWVKILDKIPGVELKTILEVGSNIGLNLRALRNIVNAEFYALEPNDYARSKLVSDKIIEADKISPNDASDINFPDDFFDLAFTSGVLIHIHPDNLERSVREIYRVSKKYIVCAEYFSDKPEEINYRGHDGFLFKRDFGDYYMDLFPDLQLLGYGFEWKRATGLDNITWWVFQKE